MRLASFPGLALWLSLLAPAAMALPLQAQVQPAATAGMASTLPATAPTTLKPSVQTNAIPPLPGPLPKSVANAGLPSADSPAGYTVPGNSPAQTALSQNRKASSASPSNAVKASGNSVSPVSNLPLGPLTSTPIGISTAPNEIRISGLGTSSTPWTIILLLTGLSLIPSLLICLTPFARLLVVFHFLRQALGLQTTPSNQTLIGLTMILTFFIMQPVGKQIYQESFVPLQAGEITAFQAIGRAETPMRNFMVHFVREKDAALFLEIAKEPRPHDIHDLSMRVLLPAYIVSELKAGFQIGAVLFLPFLVVDMVVASITTSVGMMQLPPVVISTPLKLLLFLMVDGWHLLIGALMRSFM